MKRFLPIFLIVISSVARSQAPGQINYQGIARNAVGNVLGLKNISVRLSIHDGNATGAILYQEVRNVTTNNFGMFNLAIGGPGPLAVLGTLAAVPWESGPK